MGGAGSSLDLHGETFGALNVTEEITAFNKSVCRIGLCKVINRRRTKGHLKQSFYVKFNLKFCKTDNAAIRQFVLAVLSVSCGQPDWSRDQLLNFNTGGACRIVIR